VGIKTLKNKLSEYVRLASSGETILVTDRERVVAELGPPGPSRSQDVSDAALADLVRQGVLTPPLRPPGPPPPTKPVATLAEILEELDEDRADR
jgi:antitoxin (DNA-binding transcriptional repressor) of toxin-antitoxin stability system